LAQLRLRMPHVRCSGKALRIAASAILVLALRFAR
jgi:hypothetical protein